mgnify:CR=1 FL=1
MQKKYYKKENSTNLTIVTDVKYRAKKSLGQNFLKSTLALNKIIEAGEISDKDIILEIGPGKGILTEKLLEKARIVIAIEKDSELFEFLKTKFEKEIKDKKLILLNKDILEFEMSKLEKSFWNSLAEPLGFGARKTEDFSKTCFPIRYKIIANIPYNITGAILKKFLTIENQPQMMVLMVQHEVAKRIIGKGKNPSTSLPSTSLRVKESILSISVKAYGTPKIIMKVPARYFSPAPRVDSAVIKISNISKRLFVKDSAVAEKLINEDVFWKIVKAGFAHKRKILLSNLKTLNTRQDLVQVFKKLKLSEKVRAEDLQLSDWIKIAKQL